MAKGQGLGEGRGQARGRGERSRWTANDICWVLVPTWVFGVPVLIGGIVICFYWENKSVVKYFSNEFTANSAF